MILLYICVHSYKSFNRFVPTDVIKGLFLEINSEDDTSREAAIKFLTTKIKLVPEEVMVKDVEEYIVQETKKVR